MICRRNVTVLDGLQEKYKKKKKKKKKDKNTISDIKDRGGYVLKAL